MGLVETEGLILRTHKLAEADKIAVCLTKQTGTVRGVARGARKIKSKFGASLEPFTHINLTYFEKEGRELVSIRHTEILTSYFHLARDAETVAALEYLSELAIEFAPPHQADEKLFRMVKACLDAVVENPQTLRAVVRYYEIWMLKLAGFLPDSRVCGGCGKSLAEATRGRVYLTGEAHLRCADCAGAAGTPLEANAYEQLLATRHMSPGAWASRVTSARASEDDKLAPLTRRLIERALERKPRGQASSMPQVRVQAPETK